MVYIVQKVILLQIFRMVPLQIKIHRFAMLPVSQLKFQI